MHRVAGRVRERFRSEKGPPKQPAGKIACN